MARKNGLNRKEQLQAAKWMEEGIAPKAIAKKFRTTETIVKRFTQEKLDAADKAALKRKNAYAKQRQVNQAKAEVLNSALSDLDTETQPGANSANAEEFK